MVMVYLIERCVYFSAAALFLIVPAYFSFSNDMVNKLLTITLILIFVYHFVISRMKTPVNTIYSNRMFKRYYKKVNYNTTYRPAKVKRKGDNIVLTIYFMYVFAVAICAHFHWLVTWNSLMFGVLFLLGLNNIFKYKVCLIKLWVYKDTNCCLDCHINGWDDMLIFSILPFMILTYSPLSWINWALIVVISASAVVNLILWEGGLYFFPERYFPETNAQLRCENCNKKLCVGREKHKYESEHMKTQGSTGPGWRSRSVGALFRDHYVAFTLVLNGLLLATIFFLTGKKYFFDYYIFIIITCTIVSWSIIYKWVERTYKKLFYEHIDPIVVWNDRFGNESNKIYATFAEGMFQINSIRNVIIYTGAMTFWIIFLYDIVVEGRMDLPENVGTVRQLIVILIMAYNLMVGCRAFVIFYNAYRQLVYIASLPVRTDYASDGYIHIQQIRKFCSMAILIISLVCMLAVIAVTYGPIQYTDHFRIFTISALCLVALCPIVIYIVVQNNLAIISNKMKVKTLKIYDKKAKRDTTIDEATKLKNRIEFCHSLFQMREGPKFVKDYTAMFTFLSGIIQLAIILMENQWIKRTMDLDKAIQTIYTQI